MHKENRQDRIFNCINYAVMTLLFLIVTYPLLYVLSASFSSADAIIQGRVRFLPADFSLEGYKAVFAYKAVTTGFANSVFYMATGTTVNIILTVMLAYPLSRHRLAGRRFVTLILIFTMVFNAGLIPNYMLVNSLGLIDKRAVMIIPKSVNVWNTMITISYFRTSIPSEMLEAARIDGCDDLGFIRRIVLPLSKPIIAVIALFYAVEHWNSYFDAMIYLKRTNLRPLPLMLREILVQNQMSMDMISSMEVEDIVARQNLQILLKYSLIVISSIPLLAAYPFVQKHFVKGIMVGSVKG